ncbi:MAG TPA: glutathione S-transferase family protein [Caulobacteraceae bacterium]|jgi:glutathione S-transferase|nr:glutathione S-transferase family protein [Caulobacteraceae bacterium]
MELLIGDKLWSSWSMRPWLALTRTGAPFTETLIRLRREETNADARAAGSPNGQVPVLKDGDATVWDSLAICEYLAEQFPAARLWPSDSAARALGRSAAAEMHSSFASLRGECPMDLSLKSEIEVSEATHNDLRRLVALWSGLLSRFGGDFLVGEWSIADAFFTPVATRLRSYGLRLTDYGDLGPCGAYAERLLETPEFLDWEKGALSDVRPA